MTIIGVLGLAFLIASIAYAIGWEHAVVRLRPEINRVLKQNDP